MPKLWVAGAADDENGVVGCVRLKHVFFMSDRLRGDASDGEDLAHRARATASGNGARREQRSQLAHDLRRPRALVASDLDGDDGGEDARRTRKPPGGPTAGATGEGAGGQIGGPAGRGGPGAHPP